MTSKVISIVLGGGQGSRLAPLTETRSKPAVPIAGKYRLVDIPISNCLHSGISRIFVLTQFNSASLNKHIKNTYHFSTFSTLLLIFWLPSKPLPAVAGSRARPMR
jgi:glucose-1-phosphate adenylyltransferase